MPGIREVKPTSPCAPGVSPVPSEVRLVAVVDGTPAVPASLLGEQRGEERRRVARGGASSSAPSPSTRKTTYDGASRERQAGRRLVRADGPSAAATAGTTSPSERSP